MAIRKYDKFSGSVLSPRSLRPKIRALSQHRGDLINWNPIRFKCFVAVVTCFVSFSTQCFERQLSMLKPTLFQLRFTLPLLICSSLFCCPLGQRPSQHGLHWHRDVAGWSPSASHLQWWSVLWLHITYQHTQQRPAADVESSSLPLTYVFVSLQLFGLTGTTIMLVTAMFSSGVPRHSTWFSFMLSWIIYTLSYNLLFFAGQLPGPEPPYGLCLIQSIMVCSAPPLCVINHNLKLEYAYPVLALQLRHARLLYMCSSSH